MSEETKTPDFEATTAQQRPAFSSVEEYLEWLEGQPISVIANEWSRLQQRHAEIKAHAAEVWKAVDAIRFRIMLEKLEEADLTKVSVEGIGSVYVQDDIRTKVLDKESLRDWLDDHDHSSVIKEQVHAQSLQAVIRGIMKSGGGMPSDDIVTVEPFSFAKIKKG